MAAKTLLLIGAGHANLLLTCQVRRLRAAGLDPVMLSPRWFHYSGLATGVLSGALPDDANRVDVAALCACRGIFHVDASCTGIEDGRARIDGGGALPFDFASVNVGSHVAAPFPAVPAKPLANLTVLKRRLIAAGRARIAVAGAGPTGTEIAACLAGLAERQRLDLAITLCGPRPDWPGLYRSLAGRGVALEDAKIVGHAEGAALLDGGGRIPVDEIVAATGLVGGPPAIPVDATLRSRDDPRIFAAGDCADFLPRPLPKHGVFGVRQAPVLLRNLIAAAEGRPLARYRPQRRWLSIMDLGDGSGFATWGGLSHRSRAALLVKRRLDLAFVSRFR
ncbi:MAG: NAD(P)/FAD-dependent oxidoreductase [Allosphingosinicella sp.]|uniref:NAD(P)/FAD-dependent oxidoreductase n=1 Tax=Allosphingosinicella sp. TaxID=2823234 RepID=UPI00394C9572